jgi:phosphomevalonate kinase
VSEGPVETAQLSVPGNLLLLGEYAVLEEGGLGIAVAIERRIVIDIEAADELTIVGRGGGYSGSWTRSEPGPSGLAGAVVAATERELGLLGLGAKAPPLRLRIDSSALFGSEGTKLGLGSSAAVAVGTALALLRASGLEDRALGETSFRAALAGHRSHQGGIGSGYDVAVSLHGGWGLFTGGELPGFQPLELPWIPPFYLLRGGPPVDTARAVRRYMEWKRQNPRDARSFLEASNETVRDFAAAGNWSEASMRLREAALLGARIGDAIAVPSRIEGLEGRIGKALGAGDELGLLWREGTETADVAGGIGQLEVATRGPLWRG